MSAVESVYDLPLSMPVPPLEVGTVVRFPGSDCPGWQMVTAIEIVDGIRRLHLVGCEPDNEV